MSANEIFRVGVILTPGFSLMAFAALVEPLRGANLISDRGLYAWHHLSPVGGAVSSGGGLAVLTDALPPATAIPFDMVVVCGGMGSDTYRNAALKAYLVRLSRQNVIIGSASTASFILAACGLLADRPHRSPGRPKTDDTPLGGLAQPVLGAIAGDGLVPLNSALGQHDDPARRLAFAKDRQCIAWRTGHLDLLSSPAVAAQLLAWLRPQPSAAG